MLPSLGIRRTAASEATAAALWPSGILLPSLPAALSLTYMKLRNTLRKSWLLERLGEYSLLIFLLNVLVRDQLLHNVTSPASCLFWAGRSVPPFRS